MSDRAIDACTHERCVTTAKLTRIEDIRDPEFRMVDVAIACEDCGATARWQGLPGGVSFTRPMVGIFDEELRAPVRFSREHVLPISGSMTFDVGKPPTGENHDA